MEHWVEYIEHSKRHVAEFKERQMAYEFWLDLRPGVRAKLYQNGVLVGEGDGNESGK